MTNDMTGRIKNIHRELIKDLGYFVFAIYLFKYNKKSKNTILDI